MGRKLDKATKSKISEAHKGKPKSKAHAEAIKAAWARRKAAGLTKPSKPGYRIHERKTRKPVCGPDELEVTVARIEDYLAWRRGEVDELKAYKYEYR